MPLARGVLVVIVEVGHGGAVEVIVSPAGNRAPNSELGRLQRRTFAVPNEVLGVAGRTGIATPVVYISPIVEFRRVDAQKVVGGEELAAKGTVEGLLVLGVVLLCRKETEVIQEAFVAFFVVFFDDLGLVARQRIAVGVNRFSSQMASPDFKELIAVGVGELCSQSCQSHLFLGSAKGQDFDRHLCGLFVVKPSSLFHESALDRVGLHSASHLGEGSCSW